MIIFDGFIAGVICGVSGFAILLILISLITYQRQEKTKAELSRFLDNLDEATMTVIAKGENNEDESNN